MEVTFKDVPAGVTLNPATIAADQTELNAPVVAAENAPLGKGTVTVTATATAQGETLTATSTVDVEVIPVPPTLAVAAPKELLVYTKGEGTFTATIARRNYNDEVTITVEDLPAGITAIPATIPPGGSEVNVTLKADITTPLDAKKLTVVARAAPAGLKATASTSLTVKEPPVAPVDVIFVLDVTASMQWALGDLKNGIVKFSDSLTKSNITFRLGLVTFRDIYDNPADKPEVMMFDGKPFTSDGGAFRDKIGTLKAEGGGDIPESSLEGVEQAVKLFEPQDTTTKMILLITDAPPKVVPEANTINRVQQVAMAIKDKKIHSVNVVIDKLDQTTYQPLQDSGSLKGGGKYFNIQDLVRSEGGFDALMSDFGKDVTAAARSRSDAKPQVADAPAPPKVGEASSMSASEAPPTPSIKGLQASGDFAAGTGGQLTLAIGVWTGAIAALLCLALLSGQNHYLRGGYPPVFRSLAGFAGGLLVGIVGGAAGQGLFMLSPVTAFKVMGWTLMGGLAGAGLSLFIPNLKWFYGLAGGAIGGALGGLGYNFVTSVAGDLVGRVSGGLIVGFFIGLMVALVEAAFRSAWLEVRYGARETIAVNLGPEPVKVGGDPKLCTVWARGAAPLALRFFLRDGQVICDDATMKRENAVGNGYAKEVGNVTVTVRTGSGAAAPTVQPSAPTLPPPKPGPSAPTKPPILEDDFDFAPVAKGAPPVAKSPPPPPTPVAAPTVPSAGSRPTVPPVPVPPPPAAKPPVPAAAVSRPAPPVPPKPAAPVVPPSKPSAPPVPSATKPSVPVSAPPKAPVSPPATSPPAAGKHPDACPGCGRVNAGKPKVRYCMVCDRTY